MDAMSFLVRATTEALSADINRASTDRASYLLGM